MTVEYVNDVAPDFISGDDNWNKIGCWFSPSTNIVGAKFEIIAFDAEQTSYAYFYVQGLYTHASELLVPILPDGYMHLCPPIKSATSQLWDIRLIVDQNNCLSIEVRGEQQKTILWFVEGKVQGMTNIIL
jgi:hypothetical protein